MSQLDYSAEGAGSGLVSTLLRPPQTTTKSQIPSLHELVIIINQSGSGRRQVNPSQVKVGYSGSNLFLVEPISGSGISYAISTKKHHGDNYADTISDLGQRVKAHGSRFVYIHDHEHRCAIAEFSSRRAA